MIQGGQALSPVLQCGRQKRTGKSACLFYLAANLFSMADQFTTFHQAAR
jgi:hypothetical protein